MMLRLPAIRQTKNQPGGAGFVLSPQKKRKLVTASSQAPSHHAPESDNSYSSVYVVRRLYELYLSSCAYSIMLSGYVQPFAYVIHKNLLMNSRKKPTATGNVSRSGGGYAGLCI
jgi:hypothetical protein